MTSSDDLEVRETASRLRLAITRLNRLMRQQGNTELTPTKLAHLSTIVRDGPLALGELAVAEQVAAPTVTQVVKDLAKLGLVERIADDSDGRVTLVQGTVAGQEQLDDVRGRKDQWLSEQLGALSAKELTTLVDAITILEKVIAPR